jgi:hypothetical protein
VAPAAGRTGEVIAMRAHVGDRLVVGADRVGMVIGVPAKDGSPPYIVKWLTDGNIAMVSPDPYSRIIPSGDTASTDARSAQASRAGDKT